jgi:hypothetical protein
MSNESERDLFFLRLGGIAALIGGIGGLVTNALHPRVPQKTDELLTLVASRLQDSALALGAGSRRGLVNMARHSNAA